MEENHERPKRSENSLRNEPQERRLRADLDKCSDSVVRVACVIDNDPVLGGLGMGKMRK